MCHWRPIYTDYAGPHIRVLHEADFRDPIDTSSLGPPGGQDWNCINASCQCINVYASNRLYIHRLVIYVDYSDLYPEKSHLPPLLEWVDRPVLASPIFQYAIVRRWRMNQSPIRCVCVYSVYTVPCSPSFRDPPLRRCTSLPSVLDTLQQNGEDFVYPLTPEATPTHNHTFSWDTSNFPADQHHHDQNHLSLTPPPTPTLGSGSAASQAGGWTSGLGRAVGWLRHMGSEMVQTPKLPET